MSFFVDKLGPGAEPTGTPPQVNLADGPAPTASRQPAAAAQPAAAPQAKAAPAPEPEPDKKKKKGWF